MFQEREWGCSGRMRYFKTGSSALGEPHASARLALAVHSARAVPGGAVGKESTCNARNMGSVPGSRRSPVGGRDNPPQYSCLENPMDRGACQATVRGVAQSDMTEGTQHSPLHQAL